jgi:hypothetical protein
MGPAMLREKVFICQDISAEIEELKRLGKSFIAFQDFFRIHSFVAGNNNLYMDLFSSKECAEGFYAIRRGLIKMGIDETTLTVMEDISDGRDQQHGT